MTLASALREARKAGYQAHALAILRACARAPQNPQSFFKKQLALGWPKNWAYAYFERLASAGYLVQCDPPKGRRGFHWYILRKE